MREGKTLRKILSFLLLLIITCLLVGWTRYIPFGNGTLMDWQRQAWEWNYLGILMNFVLFLTLVWYSKLPMKKFGLHMGTWKDYSIKYIVILLSVLILSRIADGGHLTFHMPTFSTIFFQLVFVAWGEELLWRGYIQTVFGIWYASIGFGMLHIFGSISSGGDWVNALIYGVVTFLLGMILGYIRKKTDSIHASALLHGLYNVTSYFVY